MSDELTKERIHKYFQLKAKYDEQKDKLIKTKYNKLKEKNFSKREIKEAIKNMNVPCINCNKSGGTIFEIKDDAYIAKCKNNIPCKLNIEIHKGSYLPSDKILKENKDEIDDIKCNIIKTKMKHKMDYIDVGSASKLFKDQKQYLNEASEFYFYSKIILEDLIEEANKDDAYITDEVIEEFKNGIREYEKSLNKTKLKETIAYQIENIDKKRGEKIEVKYHNTQQINGTETKIINYTLNI